MRLCGPATSTSTWKGRRALPLKAPLSIKTEHLSSIHMSTPRSAEPSPFTLAYSIHTSGASILKHGGELFSPATLKNPFQPLQRSQGCGASASVGAYSPGGRSKQLSSVRGESVGRSTAGTSSAVGASSTYAAPTTPTSARRYSMPTPPEQDHFESLCRQRFYEASHSAAREVQSVLASAPSSAAQTCYNRILARVRTEYHDHVARKRREALEQALAEEQPRFLSREERRRSLGQFLQQHVTKELVGAHPFAKSLYVLLNLQATNPYRGGAGPACIEWTLSDEVSQSDFATSVRRCIQLY